MNPTRILLSLIFSSDTVQEHTHTDTLSNLMKKKSFDKLYEKISQILKQRYKVVLPTSSILKAHNITSLTPPTNLTVFISKDSPPPVLSVS